MQRQKDTQHTDIIHCSDTYCCNGFIQIGEEMNYPYMQNLMLPNSQPQEVVKVNGKGGVDAYQMLPISVMGKWVANAPAAAAYTTAKA